MLRPEMKLYAMGQHGETAGGTGFIWRAHYLFNRRFEMFRSSYSSLLHWSLDHRLAVLAGFTIFSLGSLGLAPLIGSDFFPTVDSGQMRLHAQAPAGTRIEQTELIFAAIEREIRQVIPSREIDTIIDNIGIPNSGFNLAFGDSAVIGTGDGDILISLKEGDHGPTAEYIDHLRKRLNQKFPEVVFFFEAANITNQILNFGLPAAIDVQVIGRDATANYAIARNLSERISHIPGAADVHIHQVVDYPEIRFNVDRTKAGQFGLTQRDVSNSLLISLSSSGQVAPAQWMNWDNGVNYQVAVQTPQYKMNSLDALLRTPIAAPQGSVATHTADSPAGSSSLSNSSVGAAPSQASAAYGNPGMASGNPQLLSNLATVSRGLAPEIVNHYNVQPLFDVYANVDRRDLGSVGSAVERIMEEASKKLPKGTTLDLKGQVTTMRNSFRRLGLGMIVAVVLVYLLMAVNFQSWLDPFIILMALPGALAGIVWMLFITQTTFSVPSLMGAIMCIGVATANSILMVVFANDQRAEGMDPISAALAAGQTRIRPVLMTALAMIIGMLPMALGFGEGGEQNAPLGRAVIGGLLLATLTTLFVVPIVYSLLRKEVPIDYDRRIAEEEAEGLGDALLT
jgi:multidrug efflux pump subunit AcrB